MDFVAKRLTDAPHISTGQLTKEIVAKFGTNLSPIILADLRRRLGIGASKVRCDRAMPGMVAGAQPRPQPLPQPQPQPQPESEPETANAPNQNQTPVADALRKVVQHMRHKGIERLVLHDDGTYDRYYRQLNVFTPDA
jgi:predicted component of type VI protein secretion system